MQRCRDMKRREPGLRWVTGLLLMMLWLQGSLPATETATIQQPPMSKDTQERVETGVQPQKNNGRFKETVHLLTARGPNGIVVESLHEQTIYIWWMHQKSGNIFKLVDNNTTLVVPKKGLYFVNLKINYQIPAAYKCKENLILGTSIQQYHDSYPQWTDVLWGTDTMQCMQNWFQSVTLSQVVRFRKGTKLRVITGKSNYNFTVKDDRTYFSVTLL